MKRVISIFLVALIINVIVGGSAYATYDNGNIKSVNSSEPSQTLTPIPDILVDFVIEQRNAGVINDETADLLLAPYDSPDEVPWQAWYEAFLKAYATLEIIEAFCEWYERNGGGTLGPGPNDSPCPGNPWNPYLEQ